MRSPYWVGIHKAGFECSTMKTWMVVDSSWIKGLSVAYFFLKKVLV